MPGEPEPGATEPDRPKSQKPERKGFFKRMLGFFKSDEDTQAETLPPERAPDGSLRAAISPTLGADSSQDEPAAPSTAADKPSTTEFETAAVEPQASIEIAANAKAPAAAKPEATIEAGANAKAPAAAKPEGTIEAGAKAKAPAVAKPEATIEAGANAKAPAAAKPEASIEIAANAKAPAVAKPEASIEIAANAKAPSAAKPEATIEAAVEPEAPSAAKPEATIETAAVEPEATIEAGAKAKAPAAAKPEATIEAGAKAKASVAPEARAVAEEPAAVQTSSDLEPEELDPPPDIMADLDELPLEYQEPVVRLQLVDPERVYLLWAVPSSLHLPGPVGFRLLRHVAGRPFVVEQVEVGPANALYSRSGSWYFDTEPSSLYEVELGCFTSSGFQQMIRSNFIDTPALKPRYASVAVWRVRERGARAEVLEPAIGEAVAPVTPRELAITAPVTVGAPEITQIAAQEPTAPRPLQRRRRAAQSTAALASPAQTLPETRAVRRMGGPGLDATDLFRKLPTREESPAILSEPPAQAPRSATITRAVEANPSPAQRAPDPTVFALSKPAHQAAQAPGVVHFSSSPGRSSTALPRQRPVWRWLEVPGLTTEVMLSEPTVRWISSSDLLLEQRPRSGAGPFRMAIPAGWSGDLPLGPGWSGSLPIGSLPSSGEHFIGFLPSSGSFPWRATAEATT